MSEDERWKNDSKDLDRLLSSYDDYTEDGSVGSGGGLLDGSYVDVNRNRGYGLDEKEFSSTPSILKFFILFATVGAALKVYATVMPGESSFPMKGGRGDGMNANTISNLSPMENKYVDDFLVLDPNNFSDEELSREVDDLANFALNTDMDDEPIQQQIDDLAQTESVLPMDDGIRQENMKLTDSNPDVGIDNTSQKDVTDDLNNPQSNIETNDVDELLDDDDDVKFTATEKTLKQKQQVESTISTSTTEPIKTNLRKPTKNDVTQDKTSIEEVAEIIEAEDSETVSNVIEENKNGPQVKRVALLAERNSGLSWFASAIHSCFPDLDVTMGLSRASHWFQSNETAILEPTLVLPLFLNTFHWVDSMRRSPHHAPNHKNMEWVQFVSAPWSVHRPKEDFELLEQVKDTEKLNCQLDFKYKEVISCSDMTVGLGKDGPIYELNSNGSGEPYLSVLRLRRDKILNWLSTSEWENVEFFHPVHYEDLAERGGLLAAIKVIELKTNSKSICSYDEARNKLAPIFWEDLQPDYVDWMKNNAIWDVEKKIGYDKIVPKVMVDTSFEVEEKP